VLVAVLGLLFGLPWWALVLAPGWPLPAEVAGAVVFAGAAVGFPLLMALGHRSGGRDWAARTGDTLLGVIWVLFVWSAIGSLLRPVLPGGARTAAVAAALVALALLLWGHYEAMRVPRIREVEIPLDRLGTGLDGLRVVVLTDTHYGPIDRAAWSAKVAEEVNRLDPDVLCHAGDIADGTAEQRRAQAAPLGAMRARLAKVFVTGNHEYYSGAQGWLDRLDGLGWEPLRNRHLVVERGGDSLVLAGVDDLTAESSGLAGHRADLEGALAGADPELPVLLLAHQPKYVTAAAEAGVDLQISGHTHGGQIWPFHFLVRVDQPVVAGLSRHGLRTRLYTSRGTGFWGPPFRVFAPSEITVLTLRTASSQSRPA
jgi:predicted MPP superfamily phosphohydrolase